jgi:hypothetical protein
MKIKLKDKPQSITTIRATDNDEITIPIPQSGRHRVRVKLGHFQGDVDVRWRRIRGADA